MMLQNIHNVIMSSQGSGLPPLSEIDMNVIFDGDSLTYGRGSSVIQYYPKKIQTRLESICKSVTFASYGVQGQNTQDMLADQATQILSLIDPLKTNVVVAWEDVNAILNDGRTAQENFDDFSTYYTNWKNAGGDYAIHIGGYYPRTPYNNALWDTGSPSPLDNQHDYFELCKANLPNNSDILCDLRLANDIGGGRGLVIDPLVNDDSIHQVDLGYDRVEEYIWLNGFLKLFSFQ